MCACNKRRSYTAVTSANIPAPITPAQSVANAVANASTDPKAPVPTSE